MKKINPLLLLLIIFINNPTYASELKNKVFINTLGIANSANGLLLDTIIAGPRVVNITNKDKVIYYYAEIGVLNPTKKQYDVKIICTDKYGNIIMQGHLKRKLHVVGPKYINGDIVKYAEQTLGLDPQKNKIVRDQLTPLKDNHDYYIKLFFEKKLIAITKFHYDIVK